MARDREPDGSPMAYARGFSGCQHVGDRVEDHDDCVAAYAVDRAHWRKLVAPPRHLRTGEPGPAHRLPVTAPIRLCDRHAVALDALPYVTATDEVATTEVSGGQPGNR